MIVIAEPYARYTETLPDSELESAAARLLQLADGACRDYFAERYEQLGITAVARVEIGSTKTWTTIKAVTTALVLYGSLRQSADYLAKDGDWLSRIILPNVASTIGLQSNRPERQERRLGVPGQLRRLFVLVERGGMSAEEATSRAVHLLHATGDTDAANELPRLTQRLVAEFAETARQRGTQLTLEEDANHTDHARDEKQPQPPQRPEIALPPITPARRRRGVIATRDSRTGHISLRTY
jgi:hypothetical protein